MPDVHYEHERLAALYDAGNGWSDDRDFYLSLAGTSPAAVLDIGCGTGLLCDAYAARGHRATGVDPSRSMLAVARDKPHAARVRWVESSAAAFASEVRFDLIVMTGHVFQVFLTDAEVAAALATVRAHLAPDGKAVFESRNPSIDWQREWNDERELITPDGAVRETLRTAERRGDRLSFTQTYAFPDDVIVSASTLRFMTEGAIRDGIERAGLDVVRVEGDWHGAPFDPGTSREMVFTARISSPCGRRSDAE